MARAKPPSGPMHRVHRPRLTPAEQVLAVQYRPQERCGCGREGREWLMETATADRPLEFYCSGCGMYRLVECH
jgi:hypothetical protein